MASLQETEAAVDGGNNWIEGIYQLEETDLVVGGPDGIDNLQAKQLQARINWVRSQVLASLSGMSGHLADADPHPQYLTEVEGNALINSAVAALVASSPAALDTLNELATALGNDPNFATTITSALALKAPLASPALTGNPTAPTPAMGDNSTKLATTAFIALTLAGLKSIQPLTDGATITPDFAAAENFSVTLGGNRTLANPSNITAGQSGVIAVSQDATGGRTLAFGSYWKFEGGAVPSLSTTPNALDLLVYYCHSATAITVRLISSVA